MATTRISKATAARRAAAVAKAAGPYGPADVTLDEILAPHPAPRVYQAVVITPDMATAMLERNAGNRRISRRRVDDLAEILRSGRWQYTHQGVAFDVDGTLQDGQHRLSAIVLTGLPASMLVSVGMSARNFSVIDTGMKRSAAQMLYAAGVTDANQAASVVRLLMAYYRFGEELLANAFNPWTVTNDEILEMYEKYDLDRLRGAISAATKLYREVKANKTATSAAFYVIYEVCGTDSDRAGAFIVDLTTGEGLQRDDPVFVLRRNLVRQSADKARRLKVPATMALVVKAWNYRIDGETPSMLVIRDDSPMPIAKPPHRHPGR